MNISSTKIHTKLAVLGCPEVKIIVIILHENVMTIVYYDWLVIQSLEPKKLEYTKYGSIIKVI